MSIWLSESVIFVNKTLIYSQQAAQRDSGSFTGAGQLNMQAVLGHNITF